MWTAHKGQRASVRCPSRPEHRCPGCELQPPWELSHLGPWGQGLGYTCHIPTSSPGTKWRELVRCRRDDVGPGSFLVTGCGNSAACQTCGLQLALGPPSGTGKGCGSLALKCLLKWPVLKAWCQLMGLGEMIGS